MTAMLQAVLATFLGMSAGGWTALASWCALLLALVLAGFAGWQAMEARRLRLEQARPYVAVFAEPSRAAFWVFEVVVRNFGRTPATDVRVTFEPELRRAASQAGGALVELPEVIPVLVPGQEWRTLWDSQLERSGADLPSRHVVTVTFRDTEGRHAFSSEFVLDWEAVARRDVVNVLGVHEAASALKAISDTIARWRS